MIIKATTTVISPSLFAAAVAILDVYGTTPWAAACALGGAVLAWLEASDRHWLTRSAIGGFNITVGVLGGPVVALAAKQEWGLDHPAILVLASLLLGYLARGAIDTAKRALAARVSAWRRK